MSGLDYLSQKVRTMEFKELTEKLNEYSKEEGSPGPYDDPSCPPDTIVDEFDSLAPPHVKGQITEEEWREEFYRDGYIDALKDIERLFGAESDELYDWIEEKLEANES